MSLVAQLLKNEFNNPWSPPAKINHVITFKISHQSRKSKGYPKHEQVKPDFGETC